MIGMKCENIKMILFMVFVIISFVFMWGIWMFQLNFFEGLLLIEFIVCEKYKIEKNI